MCVFVRVICLYHDIIMNTSCPTWYQEDLSKHPYLHLKQFSHILFRQCLENQIQNLSGVACSHIQHTAGDSPGQMRSHGGELVRLVSGWRASLCVEHAGGTA